MRPPARPSLTVNWRYRRETVHSFAPLAAACVKSGYTLNPVREPAGDVTCYSLTSLNYPALFREMDSAECITVAGGPHATAVPFEVARHADYVVIGEGEFTLPRLLDALGRGESGELIAGVATATSITRPDTTVLLDAYPPFGDLKGYVEVTRGCPHRCAYCQTPRIFGDAMRHRSIDAIVSYASRYSHARFVTPNALAYGSDGLHPRFDRVESLLRRLKNRIYFGTFPSEVRPEWISDRSLDLIRTYCANRRIHFGAQSGSDRVLRAIGRGHTLQDVNEAVDLCVQHDLVPIVDVILGLPGETDEDQRDTLTLVRSVVRVGKVHAHRFIPLPGTPFSHHAPEPLIPEAEKLLGSLALNGRVTGSWSDPRRRFLRRTLE